MPAAPYVDAVGNLLRITMAALYPTGVPGQQVEEMNATLVCTVSGGGDSRAALLAAIDGVVGALVVPTLPAAASYYGSKAGQLNVTPPPLAKTTTPNTPGTATGDQLPTQTRGLIRFGSDVGGRTGRGRMYAFTPADSFSDISGSPTAPYLVIIGNIGGAFLAGFTVGGSTWRTVIAHRSKTTPHVYTFDPVTTTGTQPHWCTQRRSGESGRVNARPW